MSLQSDDDDSNSRSSLGQSQEMNSDQNGDDSSRVNSIDQSMEQTTKDPIININTTDKITIRFKPIGSTSPINPPIFKISPDQTISMILKFLCKRLKVKFIYIYILNSFQPNPDEILGELFKTFQVNDELIINYCNTMAFG